MKDLLLALQQKMKEEKELKRAQIDARHEYIIDAVARSLTIDRCEVRDGEVF